MTHVDISKQLPNSTKLWRYMSLAKLIDLLSTSELFFAPLSFFVKADPYEGYLPIAAVDALAGIIHPKIKDLELFVSAVEDRLKSEGRKFSGDGRNMIDRNLEDLKVAARQYFTATTRCQTVNCWHVIHSESEAMWRLYSETGTAVAIETSIEAFKESIRLRESPHHVHIYPVKYLDFFDTNLKPSDCTVEGHTTPLLKRKSYQHEKEVRAFIGRAPNDGQEPAKLEFWKPSPVRLPVDLHVLIQRVHLSPYSREPFAESVTTICELFGLREGVVEPSKLLSGQEELLNRLDY